MISSSGKTFGTSGTSEPHHLVNDDAAGNLQSDVFGKNLQGQNLGLITKIEPPSPIAKSSQVIDRSEGFQRPGDGPLYNLKLIPPSVSGFPFMLDRFSQVTLSLSTKSTNLGNAGPRNLVRLQKISHMPQSNLPYRDSGALLRR